MQLRNALKELQKQGLQILDTHKGFSRHVIEVAGQAPAHLPVITETKNGQTRQVRPAKLHGQIVMFIEG
ncbi:Kil protein for bacterial septation inhibition [Pseudoalteromonas phage HS6]|uniref:Kil protein for bacterial septation inhibition n=1 Tax=Pseudoalteromonas phage HS6 TaxID=1357710 RepID=UPI00232921F1|nr:Kil protein for bacterial septation inhibition [Pseudoalteromonas phage HS6]